MRSSFLIPYVQSVEGVGKSRVLCRLRTKKVGPRPEIEDNIVIYDDEEITTNIRFEHNSKSFGEVTTLSGRGSTKSRDDDYRIRVEEIQLK